MTQFSKKNFQSTFLKLNIYLLFRFEKQHVCNECKVLVATEVCAQCKTKAKCFYYQLPSQCFRDLMQNSNFLKKMEYKRNRIFVPNLIQDVYDGEEYLVCKFHLFLYIVIREVHRQLLLTKVDFPLL